MQIKKSLLMILLICAKINFIFITFFCYSNGLQITEVFPYGQNERIEIYNDDSKNFSGTLKIDGIKSKSLKIDVDIEAGKFLIIGDKIDFTGNFAMLSGMGLSISDTKDIKIFLSVSGHVLDNFVYSGQVQKEKNFSIQKIWVNDKCLIITTIDVYSNNLVKGVLANPGKIVLTDKIITKKAVLKNKTMIKKQSSKNTKDEEISTKEKRYLEKIEKLEVENKELKQDLKLTKNTLYLTWTKLWTNRNVVYKNGGFEKIKDSYNILSKYTGDNIKVGNINVDRVDIYDYIRALSRKKSLDLNTKIYIFIRDNFFNDLIKPINERISDLILLIQKFGGGNIDVWSFEPDIFSLSTR